MLISNKNFQENLINFLLIVLPLSFILGNLAINLNIIILIVTVLLFYRGQILKIKFLIIDKIIILFFFYILTNGIINNYFFEFSNPPNEEFLLTKSLAYIRYLFLYFVIRFLVLKKLIKYKYLFFIFGMFGFFVSVDIIVQYFFGKDLLGFEGSGRRLSGPFQDEYVAGAFIQRFFIFLPLAIILYWKKEKKFFYYLLVMFVFFIGLFGITFSGNRVPLVLFVLTVTIFLIYQKDFHKILIVTLSIFISCVYYLANNNAEFGHHYKGFVYKGFQITDYLKNKINNNSIEFLANSHIKEIETGILTWKQNKFFGGGIKSFFFNCVKIENSIMDRYGGTNCNSHPHNYYLQIAVELGIFGLFIVIYLFFLLLYKIIKFLHFSKNNLEERNMLIPFYALLIAEIFPFKSSGSFFTTATSTFIFILIPFIVSFTEKKKLNHDKK